MHLHELHLMLKAISTKANIGEGKRRHQALGKADEFPQYKLAWPCLSKSHFEGGKRPRRGLLAMGWRPGLALKK